MWRAGRGWRLTKTQARASAGRRGIVLNIAENLEAGQQAWLIGAKGSHSATLGWRFGLAIGTGFSNHGAARESEAQFRPPAAHPSQNHGCRFDPFISCPRYPHPMVSTGGVSRRGFGKFCSGRRCFVLTLMYYECHMRLGLFLPIPNAIYLFLHMVAVDQKPGGPPSSLVFGTSGILGQQRNHRDENVLRPTAKAHARLRRSVPCALGTQVCG